MNKKLKDKKIPKGKRKNFIKEIFCVNNKFDFIALLRNILIPVIGGGLIGLITKGSMSTYDSLRKSMFNPPAIVFQIVWGVLYFLMGIASYRIYMNNKYGKNDYTGYSIINKLFMGNNIFKFKIIWYFFYINNFIVNFNYNYNYKVF